MQFYLSAIRLLMEDILEPIKQLRKCCNLDFSGPIYSRTLIDMCRAMTDVSELVLYPEEMKCC